MFKFTHEIITCMISHDDLGLVPWKSTGRSTEFNFFFTDWGQICTELQDITIERQFPLYSMQILPECQIPRSVRWNSGTQAGFRAEYQGESKDLEHCHTLGLPNLLPEECPECTQRKDGGDVLPEPDEGYYTSNC